MRYFVFLLGLVLLSVLTEAQHHYIYVQTEDQQPFYIRYGQEVISSSANGYAIVPRLSDSTYSFIMGTAKSARPGAVFSVALEHKDHGFILRNKEEQITLTDFRSGDVLVGIQQEQKKAIAVSDGGQVTGDAFTNSLALAISDPQLTKTELVKKDEQLSLNKKPEQNKGVVHNGEIPKSSSRPDEPGTQSSTSNVKAPTSTNTSGKSSNKNAEIGPRPTLKTSGSEQSLATVQPKTSAGPASVPSSSLGQNIKEVGMMQKNAVSAVTTPDQSPSRRFEKPVQISDLKGNNGQEVVYVDASGKNLGDTVKVWIPNESKGMPAQIKTTSSMELNRESGKASNQLQENAKTPTKPSIKDPELQATVKAAGKEMQISNVRTDCKGLANDNEVVGLIKKMGGVVDEDDKVALALKSCKAKCHTSKQVKSLCEAFGREEGRYKLMDATYSLVFDPGNFTDLETLLKDPYFIHRFQALVHPFKKP